MSALTTIPLHFGYSCDKRTCSARRTWEPTDDKAERRRRWLELRAEGWTRWISRSDHIFCPEHAPSPGSKLQPSNYDDEYAARYVSAP